MFDLFDKLRVTDNPIKIINENAETVYEFMVYQLYGNSAEDTVLNAEKTLEWLRNADPNRMVLSNSLIYDMFVNVAKNYMSDKEEYELQTLRLLDAITKVEYDDIEDYSDEESDVDDMKGIKRKRSGDDNEESDGNALKHMKLDSQTDDEEWKDP